MLSSRSPVSLSSSSATLLLFLFVSLPLPLPLLATPAPDQYDAATGYQPKIRSIKLQSSDVLQPGEPREPREATAQLPIQTPSNDKLSSDHDKNTKSVVDASQIHRVKLTKTEYQTGVSLLPLSQVKSSQKDTIHYEGDDDLTIEDVKSLDELARTKREPEEDTSVRQKRDFIRWYGASSFQHYQPQQTYISSYQLSGRVPYFIPIWGNPSRIPVYFPLKPILFNPGYPVANPPQPPQTGIPGSTESPPEGVTFSIGNRNNFDTPVWGVVETESSNTNGGTGGVQRPTQDRKPPTPSLLHKPSRTDRDDALDENGPSINQVPNDLISGRPPQNNFPIPDDNRDPLFDLASTQRPTNLPPPTARPPGLNFPNQIGNQGGQSGGPSRCVWAVITCCNPFSTTVRYNCFEQLGCDGSFWDRNPCSRDITLAAANAAQKFYQQNASRR